jgi:hypothetical protein
VNQEIIDPAQAIPTKHSLQNQDRITAQFAIHHERWGFNPTSVQVQLSTFLEHKKQPYVRWLDDLNFDWQELEYGWLKPEQVGSVVIENRTTLGQHVNPTDEERDLHKNKIIQVSFNGMEEVVEVPPGGMPFIANLCGNKKLWLRAVAFPINSCVTIFPR